MEDADERTPMMRDQDDKPLPYNGASPVSDEHEDEPPPVLHRTKSGSKRLIIAEPLVLMCIFAFSAYTPLRQQYAYKHISDKYNMTGAHGSGGGGCPMANLGNGTNHTGNDTGNYTYIDNQLKVQQEASQWFIYMNLGHGIPAVFTVFIMGALSDKKGRKLIMIIPIIGFICQAGFGLACVLFKLNLGFLVFGEICAGLTGGLGLLATSAFSYIADTTSKENRPLRITIIEGAIGFSAAFAMISLGFAIAKIGFLWPAIIIFGLQCCSLLYTIFCIPESVRMVEPEVGKVPSKCPDFVAIIKHMFAPLVRVDKNFAGKMLVMSALIILLLSFQARQDVITLYVFNKPLCWDAIKLGIFGGIGALTSICGSLTFIAIFKKKISPAAMAVIGLLSSAIASYFNGFVVFNTVTMFLVPFLGIVAFMAVPMTKAIISSLTRPEEQGAMFAAIASIDTCSTLFGGVLMTVVYSATVADFPGFVFVVFGVLSTIASVLVIIFWRMKRKGNIAYAQVQQKDPPSDDPPSNDSNP